MIWIVLTIVLSLLFVVLSIIWGFLSKESILGWVEKYRFLNLLIIYGVGIMNIFVILSIMFQSAILEGPVKVDATPLYEYYFEIPFMVVVLALTCIYLSAEVRRKRNVKN